MKSKKKLVDWVLIGIGAVSLVVYLVTGVLLFRYYTDYQEQKTQNEQLAALRQEQMAGITGSASSVEQSVDAAGADFPEGQQAEEDALDTSLTGDAIVPEDAVGDPLLEERVYAYFKEMNPDYVGWITIPDTVIDYPVVQRDNSYYLRRDFSGESNRHGSIFMDEVCAVGDAIVMIHGHHMKDGTMFGCLSEYKRAAYREDHPLILMDFGVGEESYRIFACGLVDLTDPNSFYYEILPQNEEEKAAYLEEFAASSLWYDTSKVDTGEPMVLLSTCDYGTEDQRFILLAAREE